VSDVKKAAESAPSRVIDLDGARAARKETQPVTLKFGGKEFELPSELPIMFAELATQNKMQEALQALLGSEQSEDFFALSPSVQDLEEFANAITEVYGLDEGKSERSLGS
jgi:hypothetical protein